MKRSADDIDKEYKCGDDCECADCDDDADAANQLVKKLRQERFDAMCVDVFKDASEPVTYRAEQLIIVSEDLKDHKDHYILRFTPFMLSKYYLAVYSDLKDGNGVVRGFAKNQTIATRATMRMLAHLRAKYEVKDAGLIGVFGVFRVRVIE
jgi:hypothetical protein